MALSTPQRIGHTRLQVAVEHGRPPSLTLHLDNDLVQLDWLDTFQLAVLLLSALRGTDAFERVVSLLWHEE
jgi:hypothetical protein